MERLGAARTVDHTGDLAAQVAAVHPDGVDVVFHFAGDPAALAPLVKQGGVLVSTLVQSPDQVPAEGIRVVPVYANPSSATLDRLAENQVSGQTSVTVQQVYALGDAPSALGHFAGGTLGKIVVSVD
jgi:NADPH-dependent curcumin reductase CurA